jgi:hypothetical protein
LHLLDHDDGAILFNNSDALKQAVITGTAEGKLGKARQPRDRVRDALFLEMEVIIFSSSRGCEVLECITH